MTVDLVQATEDAIKAADHLTEMDAGAVQALRALARKIEAWDAIVDFALDDLVGESPNKRPAVPQNDNVSISAYLKYSDQLGLTPAGRKALGEKKEAARGKLADLRAVPSAGKPTAKRGTRSA